MPIANICNKISKKYFQSLFSSPKARDLQSKAEIRPGLDKCKQTIVHFPGKTSPIKRSKQK